jgi:class 3 adenylate cyclase
MSSSYFHRNVGVDAAYQRLEKLVRLRTQPGADRAAIDARIWDLFGEDWCVLFTDLAGFSRRVAEFGIIHFLQIIFESEQLFMPLVEQHAGIVLKVEGDSLLVIFRNPQRALDCAIAMQQATQAYNQDKADTDKIWLCAGLGFGRVLRIGNEDVFGAQVNAASKLGEDTAEGGEILLTQAVYEAVGDLCKGQIGFELLDYEPPGADRAYRVIYSR